MCSHRLSFCKLVSVRDNITEKIVDESTEIDSMMVHEYHSWLKSHHDTDFGILINKKHHYSYSFDALMQIFMIDLVKAIAFVVPNRAAELATMSVLSMTQKKDILHKIFYQRDEAILWLEQQLAS